MELHFTALQRSQDHRFTLHDHLNRRPHRNPHRSLRRSPLVLLQHLLNPRPRGCHHRMWLRLRLRLEGRDPPGVLVVDRESPGLGSWRRPRSHRRRRWWCHVVDPQGSQSRCCLRLWWCWQGLCCCFEASRCSCNCYRDWFVLWWSVRGCEV